MIPVLDLKAQYAHIKDEINDAISDVIESCQFSLGPSVCEFEKNFATYCNAHVAVAVNSGTSALHLALIAGGIKPGDEVITVSMTFVATAAAITYAGAVPVFVDVDPKTFNIDTSKLEAAITPKTRAIIPVHLHGLMADMDAVMKIAKENNLVVIEDAAQAHGAEYKGRRAGSIGDFGCFSFYPAKNLGAYGEAGAVVCKNPFHAETIRVLRDLGQKEKYEHEIKGFNYRMDGIQGAILNVKLKYIEEWTDARRACASFYKERLANTGIEIPSPNEDYRHVYHVYAVQVGKREATRTGLQKKNVASGIHYPIPVHLQPAYHELGYKMGDFPVSELLAEKFLSLPIYPELENRQINEVCNALIDVTKSL